MLEPQLVCVIETPRGSRNRYEFDVDTGAIMLVGTLEAVYPAERGFISGTVAENGEPLNVLVCTLEPTFPGCLVYARAVGLIGDTVICSPNHEDPSAALRADIEAYFGSSWESAEAAIAIVGQARLRASAD